MERDLRAYIWQLQKFTRELREFTAGITIEQYHSDRLRHLAIERLFILVATVLKRLESTPDLERRISDLRLITGFRNIVVHEYDELDDRKIMIILHESVPRLQQQVDAWAAELGMPDFEESQNQNSVEQHQTI